MPNTPAACCNTRSNSRLRTKWTVSGTVLHKPRGPAGHMTDEMRTAADAADKTQDDPTRCRPTAGGHLSARLLI